MENEKAKKPKFLNLFDIILLIVAAALVLAVFALKRGSAADARGTAATGTVKYTVEFTGMQNGTEKLISSGDKLVDKVKKYNVGTVTSVKIIPATVQTPDLKDGGTKDAEIPSQKNAVITIEAKCAENAKQITVDGGYIIRIGLAVSLRGPGYAGSGYIIGIERGDA